MRSQTSEDVSHSISKLVHTSTTDIEKKVRSMGMSDYFKGKYKLVENFSRQDNTNNEFLDQIRSLSVNMKEQKPEEIVPSIIHQSQKRLK